MASADDGSNPENQDFIEDVIEYFSSEVTGDKLMLLFNDQAWEKLVADANLTRDEADSLCTALNMLVIEKAMEYKEIFTKQRDVFLEKFPELKMELKKCIKELHNLVDQVEKVHKDCTISNVVADSVGICSTLLSIGGLILAPFTGGLSLGLSATGVGLGAASAVTSISTDSVDNSSKSSAKTEATKLMTTSFNRIREILKLVIGSMHQTFSFTPQINKCLEDMAEKICALRIFRINNPIVDRRHTISGLTRFGAFMAAKNISRGTVPIRAARGLGKAFLGISLLLDGVSLAENSMHLSDGAKEELSEELRKVAQEMQKLLDELTQIYRQLQSDLTQ